MSKVENIKKNDPFQEQVEQLKADLIAENEKTRASLIDEYQKFSEKYQHILDKTGNEKTKETPSSTPKQEEAVLDLAPYIIKDNSTTGLIVSGIIFSIFGVFFPNPITPTMSYLVLLALIVKNKN